MENSKLLELLSRFSAGELRAFKDYVASPFFNKNEELRRFYLYLKRLAPAFPPKKIQRRKVYSKLFPGREYDDQHLNYLMSFLLKLAEQFIGYQEYVKRPIVTEYHVLTGCIDRGLDKHFKHIYQKSLKQLDRLPLRNPDFYFQKYLLADIADKHFQKKNIRKFDVKLQQTSDYLDIYYLCNKLKYTVEMLDHQKVVSADYRVTLMDELEPYLAKHPHDDIPPIAIYYQLYLTLTKPEADEHFIKLKELINRHFSKFPTQEMKKIYLATLNFCIRKIRKGQRHYAEEALQLYLQGINNKCLYDNEYLSPWTYKNVVSLGAGLHKYDWTEKFINDYNFRLSPKHRADALHYNLADLYYRKKDFKKALHHLNRVSFSDIFYNLDSKLMLLKIFYESNEEEALLSLIASFGIFLKRNKLISDDVREAYQNFVTLLSRLTKSTGSDLNDLQTRITDTSFLVDKKWLQEQLAAKMA